MSHYSRPSTPTYKSPSRSSSRSSSLGFDPLPFPSLPNLYNFPEFTPAHHPGRKTTSPVLARKTSDPRYRAVSIAVGAARNYPPPLALQSGSDAGFEGHRRSTSQRRHTESAADFRRQLPTPPPPPPYLQRHVTSVAPLFPGIPPASSRLNREMRQQPYREMTKEVQTFSSGLPSQTRRPPGMASSSTGHAQRPRAGSLNSKPASALDADKRSYYESPGSAYAERPSGAASPELSTSLSFHPLPARPPRGAAESHRSPPETFPFTTHTPRLPPNPTRSQPPLAHAPAGGLAVSAYSGGYPYGQAAAQSYGTMKQQLGAGQPPASSLPVSQRSYTHTPPNVARDRKTSVTSSIVNSEDKTRWIHLVLWRLWTTIGAGRGDPPPFTWESSVERYSGLPHFIVKMDSADIQNICSKFRSGHSKKIDIVTPSSKAKYTMNRLETEWAYATLIGDGSLWLEVNTTAPPTAPTSTEEVADRDKTQLKAMIELKASETTLRSTPERRTASFTAAPRSLGHRIRPLRFPTEPNGGQDTPTSSYFSRRRTAKAECRKAVIGLEHGVAEGVTTDSVDYFCELQVGSPAYALVSVQ